MVEFSVNEPYALVLNIYCWVVISEYMNSVYVFLLCSFASMGDLCLMVLLLPPNDDKSPVGSLL